MLTQVAPGVHVHESEFIQSNAVVVQGPTGVLVVDPGITRSEISTLARDIRDLGSSVIAGFSTHPDWDHVLWHTSLGDVPRYATAAGAAFIREVLTHEDWEEEVAGGLPPEYIDEIPMELLGQLTPLPEGALEVPWAGPHVRIIEHRGHAPGHAALLVTDSGVLVAGDMVSDTLMPFLDMASEDPLGEYLESLRLLDELAAAVTLVIPGHGSVGDGAEFRRRIALDRAYLEALRDGRAVHDPRVGPGAPLDWLPEVHEWQAQQIAERRRT